MKYVLTLLAICLSFHFASRVEAGEPLILEGNTSLNLPKNKLNPDALGNALAPGKRKNSSVDAVVAPWQNPLSGDAKRRKAMLEALDKKNNWAFQSGEELLGLSALNSESLDSEALLDGDSEGSSSRSLACTRKYEVDDISNHERMVGIPERYFISHRFQQIFPPCCTTGMGEKTKNKCEKNPAIVCFCKSQK